jgi:hypothetical protein
LNTEKRRCHQKKEGARSNNTLTYCMGLSNVVMSELLGQNTTTDPFPCTSSLSIPVCILWSIIRHNSYAYKLAWQNCRNQRSHLAYKNLPESTSFMTPEYSSKFRLLFRSSLSYVHHHLLGQVAGATKNSNNQPSPLKTELYTLHSQR